MEQYMYSRREPALQVYTVEEPRYRHYKRRESTSSSSSYSSDSRRSVEDPPDGGTWAWIVVLACGILHICNEVVYFLFYDTIVIAKFRNPVLAKNGKEIADTYPDFMVFEDVRVTGEIVVAFASVFLGYRIVAVFGSVCTIAGFLAASFVKSSEEYQLMGFLVGFLGGFGCACWRFTAYVAIMEYFKKHRMTALILSGFGRVIGIFIGYAVISRPLQLIWDPTTNIQDIEDMTPWHTYYRCQLVPAGIALLVSLVITPLSLARTRHPGDCAWFLRIRTTRLCRSGMLMLLLSVYFLYYFGESLPSTTIIYWMESEGFSTSHILGALFAIACGVFGGYLLLAFWPLKKKLYGTLLWMGLFCLLMGLMTLIFPIYRAPYISYVSAYCIIQAAAQVMFETVLRYVIPIGFGRQYIRWVEGLLGLFGGGALIANNFIVKALEKKAGVYKNTYYWAGSCFLAAGLLAIVFIQMAICLKFKDRNREREEGPQPPPMEMYERSRKRKRESSRRREESPPRIYYGYQYR